MNQDAFLILYHMAIRPEIPSQKIDGDNVPIVHVLSSTLISLHNSPERIGSWPFSVTLSFFFSMTTLTSLARVPLGTGTVMSTSPSSWFHLYGSTVYLCITFIVVEKVACMKTGRTSLFFLLFLLLCLLSCFALLLTQLLLCLFLKTRHLSELSMQKSDRWTLEKVKPSPRGGTNYMHLIPNLRVIALGAQMTKRLFKTLPRRAALFLSPSWRSQTPNPSMADVWSDFDVSNWPYSISCLLCWTFLTHLLSVGPEAWCKVAHCR